MNTPRSAADEVGSEDTAAEIVFRKGILRGLRLLGFIITFLFVIYYALWIRWSNGLVLARSINPRTKEEIVVRDIPSSTPFGTVPFGVLDDHNYRCEYYHYGTTIVSSQTYSDRGYKLNGANITWLPDGSATVSFESAPVYTCKQGWWSKVAR